MQANRPQRTPRDWLTFALLMLLLNSACGQVPIAATTTTTPSPAAAEALEADGDLRGAANAYNALALGSVAPARQDLQLHAIDCLIRAGESATAKTLLEKVRTNGLDSDYDLRKRLLGARIALAEHQPYAAIDLLPDVPGDVPQNLQLRIRNTRAQAYEMSGNALENVRERILLEKLLSAPSAKHDNHRAIWAALATLSVPALEQLRLAPPPDLLSGWMDLAVIARTTSQDKAALQQQIGAWSQRYPHHPAAADIAPRLLGSNPENDGALPASDNGYPSQLAVLLPLSGDMADVAEAVRNGLLTAYYRHRWGGVRPQLHFYDTESHNSDLRRYYDQAVKDGAKLIIGPLSKDAVADLAHSGPLSVPVLALNQIDGTAPAHLYQFALAPEDEARQAAERASLDGHTHALVIVPAGTWGERQSQAFATRFQELGGTVARVERYAANGDLGPLIQQLLAHAPDDQSQTADMIFIVAFPRQAGLITAQLRAQQAGRLAIYATSHIYDGDGNHTAAGLDGVIFCDSPWMLSPDPLSSDERAQAARLWPGSFAANARLYALGMDAYNIVPYLGRLGDSPTTGYPGASGRLYLDAEHHVHRQLMWARYNGNTTLPINAAPSPPLTQ